MISPKSPETQITEAATVRNHRKGKSKAIPSRTCIGFV